MTHHACKIPSVSSVLALLLAGCLTTPDDLTTRSDAAVDEPVISARDAAGRSVPLEALPRRVQLVVAFPKPLDAAEDAVALFAGNFDTALATDLERAPLTSDTRARLLPSRITYGDDGRVELTPTTELDPGASYALAVAGFARFRGGARVDPAGKAQAWPLSIDASPQAGARVVQTIPAPASSGVPTNLAFCAVVLDGEVNGEQAGIWLEDPDGLAVPAEVSRFACTQIAPTGSSCVQLVPRGQLAPLSRYTLRTGARLRDAHGAQVGESSASFVTADGPDHTAPHWQAPACGLDERSIEGGCALVSDTRVTLRMQADEAARFVVREGEATFAQIAARGGLTWSRAQLQPGARIVVDVAVIDAAGNTLRSSVTLTTERELPALSITEVRADPLGREPLQEYVEVSATARTPIDLAGFSLSDSPLEPGTPIASHTQLYPGARVLLVADGFDPEASEDIAPPAGTQLVRLGKSLGRAGLANSGEPLFLRDPLGRRVSAAPATPKPKPGICLVRTSDDPRSGEPEAFGYDADGRCTPGR